MIIVQLLTILILFAIFIQDIKSRSVYWFWFPLLITLFLGSDHFMKRISFTELWQNAVINLLFVGLQLFLVSAYFAVRNRKWVNITKELLGLGDVLFLVSITFYLSVLNYMFFYLTSLLLIIIFWTAVRIVSKKNNRQIPLAGLQAFILIVFLITQHLSKKIELTSDTWLLHYIYP